MFGKIWNGMDLDWSLTKRMMVIPEEDHKVVTDPFVIEGGVQITGGYLLRPAKGVERVHEVVVEVLNSELRHPELHHLLLARADGGLYPLPPLPVIQQPLNREI